ncbi:dual specificity protein phosphatase, putative [Entamoeba invadens IP1]|uniref:protein-tyrosine-phosphatase n=1 Tax=Entamoeba invadens IP1 TaxID=370355 RepID=A0A0A1UCZ8_ENTIV|nr:dual specificity protein phosphatase, putative [Entamoeba invadens IP1]ELP91615.1 dual specificity protein phosphatase, putative [Entamoeba invadens IP1]|eukprot:XP_004258386.1 dual specificity protein phosphatase, putative [Entamoeba invadens IP1]
MGNTHSKHIQSKSNESVLLCVNHVTEILPTIFLTSRHSAEDELTYKQNDISAVLSLTTNNAKYPTDVQTKHCHVQDSFFFLLDQTLDESLEWIDTMVSSGKKVLVHCEVGMSRSASVVLAYLMKHNTWNFKTAFLYIKQKRPIVFPNPGFIIQLYQYQLKMGIKDSNENSLFVKELILQANALFQDVPVRQLWNAFLSNGCCYEKAIKDQRRLLANYAGSS